MEKLKQNIMLVLFIISFLIVSAIPELKEESFVHQTGNIKLIGLGLATIISIMIIRRIKLAKVFLYFILLLTIIFDVVLIFSTDHKYLTSYILLTLSHITLIIVFTFSKSIQSYLTINNSKYIDRI